MFFSCAGLMAKRFISSNLAMKISFVEFGL
jgi:hypothetical protein